MTFLGFKNLYLNTFSCSNSEELIAEMGGPDWIDDYEGDYDRLVRMINGVYELHNGITGLLKASGLAQNTLAYYYSIPESTVNSWTSKSKKRHKNIPEHYFLMLAYCVFGDVGLIGKPMF